MTKYVEIAGDFGIKTDYKQLQNRKGEKDFLNHPVKNKTCTFNFMI